MLLPYGAAGALSRNLTQSPMRPLIKSLPALLAARTARIMARATVDDRPSSASCREPTPVDEGDEVALLEKVADVGLDAGGHRYKEKQSAAGVAERSSGVTERKSAHAREAGSYSLGLKHSDGGWSAAEEGPRPRDFAKGAHVGELGQVPGGVAVWTADA